MTKSLPGMRREGGVMAMSSEDKCYPLWVPNTWGFNDAICTRCGRVLLKVANGIGECLPERCPRCSAEVTTDLDRDAVKECWVTKVKASERVENHIDIDSLMDVLGVHSMPGDSEEDNARMVWLRIAWLAQLAERGCY